jgi:hypothetical protein
VVRVNEGGKPFFPEKNEDYYDPLVCPQMCTCGATREKAELLEQKFHTVSRT